MSALPPIPFRNDLTRTTGNIGQGGKVQVNALVTVEWLRWLQALVNAVDAAELAVGSVSLTAQGAAIAATPAAVAVSAGLYRVSWSLRVTRAAGTSSSATVTVSWISGGVACSQAGAALTTNTVSSVQSGSILVNADDASDIDYAVAYASVGAPTMQYELSVIVESVG